jgi:hypothetical protein
MEPVHNEGLGAVLQQLSLSTHQEVHVEVSALEPSDALELPLTLCELHASFIAGPAGENYVDLGRHTVFTSLV